MTTYGQVQKSVGHTDGKFTQFDWHHLSMPGMIWYLLLAVHTWELRKKARKKVMYRACSLAHRLNPAYMRVGPYTTYYLTTLGYDNWGPDFEENSRDNNKAAECEKILTNCGGKPDELLTMRISAQFRNVSGCPHPKPSVPFSHLPHILPANTEPSRRRGVLIKLPES